MPQSAKGGKRGERGGAAVGSFPWASDAVVRMVLRMDKGIGEGMGLQRDSYSMCCARCGRVVNERGVMAPRMDVVSGEGMGP
jgi:hypothetical protein